jgi:hypothetical protein
VSYPAYAGLAITWLSNNYENAGIERTPEDDDISLSWGCLVIKNNKNAGCHAGDRHSYVPFPAYAGSAITGSLKIYQNAGKKRTEEVDNIL